MGCYHPSQDDLDVCITAAATKKTFAKLTVTNRQIRRARQISSHCITALLVSRAVAPSGAARF
jgi:hypothetical protein